MRGVAPAVGPTDSPTEPLRRPPSIQSVEQDGEWLTLTPAYDICPQPRSGGETSQAMMIGPDGFRMCQLAGCLERASTYMLPEIEARELIDHQVEVIERAWNEVAERARMTEVERSFFWRRRFLNPYAFEGYSRAASDQTPRARG